MPGEHFATETSHGSFEEIFCVGLAVLDRIRYSLEVVHCDHTCPIEAVCNPNGVNAAIKEGFALL